MALCCMAVHCLVCLPVGSGVGADASLYPLEHCALGQDYVHSRSIASASCGKEGVTVVKVTYGRGLWISLLVALESSPR